MTHLCFICTSTSDPLCQTAPLLPSVTRQQHAMGYWWEGLTPTAAPPTFASDVAGQHNQMEGITFRAALVFCCWLVNDKFFHSNLLCPSLEEQLCNQKQSQNFSFLLCLFLTSRREKHKAMALPWKAAEPRARQPAFMFMFRPVMIEFSKNITWDQRSSLLVLSYPKKQHIPHSFYFRCD